MGVLKWVDWTVSEPRYFQLQTDHTPVHLALLDEVGAGGPTQRTVGPCSAPAGSTGKRRPVQPPGTRRPVPAPAGAGPPISALRRQVSPPGRFWGPNKGFPFRELISLAVDVQFLIRWP